MQRSSADASHILEFREAQCPTNSVSNAGWIESLASLEILLVKNLPHFTINGKVLLSIFKNIRRISDFKILLSQNKITGTTRIKSNLLKRGLSYAP